MSNQIPSLSVRLPFAISLLLLLGSMFGGVHGSTFLGRDGTQDGIGALSEDAEHALLAELEGALGAAHRHGAERRLTRLEQVLRPMFGAAVKNEYGRLGPASAGYMLHRVLLQRHGWLINGLAPKGDAWAAWNTSSPTNILSYWVPDHVQKLFEGRLGERGLGLREVAILAATVEDLIQKESMVRLRAAYRGLYYREEDVLSQEEAFNVAELHLALQVLEVKNLSSATAKTIQHWYSNIRRRIPHWSSIQQSVHQVVDTSGRHNFFFSDLQTLAVDVDERYVKINNDECIDFKTWLIEIEDTSPGGAGRVRLVDFYKKYMSGTWQFGEKKAYLARLGALDATDPSNPKVIIPNYIQGINNCVAFSDYYSICCLNECEDILSHLEEIVLAPAASSTEIVEIISHLPTKSTPERRELSPWLLQRLEEVAGHHGGKIPLHGRLFAQWLHYAYPRECPFPHVAGAIDPYVPTSGSTFKESRAGMQRIITNASARVARPHGVDPDANDESPMWSMDEELLVWRPAAQPHHSLWHRHLCQFTDSPHIAFITAILSVSGLLVRILQPALSNLKGTSCEKRYV